MIFVQLSTELECLGDLAPARGGWEVTGTRHRELKTTSGAGRGARGTDGQIHIRRLSPKNLY